MNLLSNLILLKEPRMKLWRFKKQRLTELLMQMRTQIYPKIIIRLCSKENLETFQESSQSYIQSQILILNPSISRILHLDTPLPKIR